VKRLRYLNPFKIRAAVRQIRKVMGDGGPKLVRVLGVGHPEGLVIPTATVILEVESRNGRKERFAPAFPIPWPYAWSYRIARRLGVPLIRSLEPEKLSFEVPVPHRSRA
jgi:hypothetical protein